MCGAMVIMVRVKDTSLFVAMDNAPIDFPYWTIGDYGYAQKGGALVEHSCKPGVVEQFMSTWLGNVNLHYELNAQAMQRKCSKCGAKPGEACINLMERHRHGKEIPTKSPHPERYPVTEEEKS